MEYPCNCNNKEYVALLFTSWTEYLCDFNICCFSVQSQICAEDTVIFILLIKVPRMACAAESYYQLLCTTDDDGCDEMKLVNCPVL